MNIMEYSYNVILVMFYTIALSVCFFTYGETKRLVIRLYGLLMLTYIFESFFLAIFNVSDFDESFPVLDFIIMMIFSWIELYPLALIRPTLLRRGKPGPAEYFIPSLSVIVPLITALATKDRTVSFAVGGLSYAACCVFVSILYFAGLRSVRTQSGETGGSGAEDAVRADGPGSLSKEYARHIGFFVLMFVFSAFACTESVLAVCGITDFVFRYVPDYLESINFATDAGTLVIAVWLINFCRKEQELAFNARMESMLQQRMNEFQVMQTEKHQQTTEVQLKEFCRCYDLTPREQDILRYVLQGKSNQELSRELFISEGTVKTHLHSIYRKLNVSRRSQLMNRFFSYGGDASSGLRQETEDGRRA